MKKIKIVLSIFIFILVAGCSKENVIQYNGECNGLYERSGDKIKIFKMNDNIYYKIDSPNIITNGSSKLRGNKIKLDSVSEKTTLEFNDETIDIKTDYEFLNSGSYKKKSEYTKEDFYRDYYGDIKLLDSNISGIYQKDDLKIYILQTNDHMVRLLYNLDNKSDLEMEKTEEGVYYLEFFEDTYTLTFTSDEMTIDLKTDVDTKKVLNGTFKKVSNLTLDEVFNNYEAY